VDDESDREQLRAMLRYARQAIAWTTETGPHWVKDEKTIAAVAMAVGQIGECARRVSDESQARWRDLPWRLMRGMRNVLYHADAGADTAVLATTISVDLPKLTRALEAILAKP